MYLYLHSSSYHLDAYADNSSTQDSKDINQCVLNNRGVLFKHLTLEISIRSALKYFEKLTVCEKAVLTQQVHSA